MLIYRSAVVPDISNRRYRYPKLDWFITVLKSQALKARFDWFN